MLWCKQNEEVFGLPSLKNSPLGNILPECKSFPGAVSSLTGRESAWRDRVAKREEGAGLGISLIVCREFRSWKFKKTDPFDEGFRCSDFVVHGQVRFDPFNIYPLIMTVPAI